MQPINNSPGSSSEATTLPGKLLVTHTQPTGFMTLYYTATHGVQALNTRIWLETRCDVQEVLMYRKPVLHARMSHSTVCYMTASTKKTRPALVQWVRKLRVTIPACMRNAPQSVCVFTQQWSVCMLSSLHSLVDSCLCVYNGSATWECVREACPEVYVCFCTRSSVDIDVYICVHVYHLYSIPQ